MHNSPLITQCHITPHQDIIRDSLPKHFYLQCICDDFLRLPLQIRVYERHVVIAADDVSERGQPFFYTLDLYRRGEGVTQMLQLLVGGGCWDEEAVSVAGCEAPDYAGAGDGGVADGDYVLEFGLEDAVGSILEWSFGKALQRFAIPVEVFGCADGDKGVGVCECGEDANSMGRLDQSFRTKIYKYEGVLTRWSFQIVRGPP